MIYIESLMISITICLLVIASKIDMRSGMIPNKVVLCGAALLLPLDLIYYLIFNRDDLSLWGIDMLGSVVIALFLYFISVWAAGDSKLLIVTMLGLPSRLITFINVGAVPCFGLIICVFSAAFVCVMTETLILTIKDAKNKKLSLQQYRFKLPSFKEALNILISYLFVYFTMTFINQIINLFTAKIIGNQILTVVMIDFMIALIVFEIKRHIPQTVIRIITALYVLIFSLLVIFKILPISNVKIEYKALLIVLIVYLFRLAAEKYNYKEIPTKDVSKWMIPSAATVIQLNMVKGIENLPHCLSEDRRARLTQEQVDAIQMWRKTKLGKPTITIVRKIPFAIFILIGTIIFLGLEILSLWFI